MRWSGLTAAIHRSYFMFTAPGQSPQNRHISNVSWTENKMICRLNITNETTTALGMLRSSLATSRPTNNATPGSATPDQLRQETNPIASTVSRINPQTSTHAAATNGYNTPTFRRHEPSPPRGHFGLKFPQATRKSSKQIRTITWRFQLISVHRGTRKTVCVSLCRLLKSGLS